MRYRLAIICTLCLLTRSALAQVKVNTGQVKKIMITDAAGYLTSSFRNEYEIVQENGQWKTYQVRENYYKPNLKNRNPAKIFEQRDSVMHRFIKSVTQDTLVRFLQTLFVIRPRFVASDLNISIPEIRQKIDTSFLKYLDKDKHGLFHSFYDTPKKLNTILESLQGAYWTDDYPTAKIEIIKNSGDTIRVQTNRQVDYMLPWKINGTASYDININRFYMAATGLYKHRMAGKGIIYEVYSAVQRLSADTLERLRWKEIAPANTAYLRKHFEIIKISESNKESFYSFRSLKISNKKVRIGGYLNITKTDDIQKLVRFAEDTLRRFLKRPAFMMDSCRVKQGCEIKFAFSSGASNHNYFAMFKPELGVFLDKFDKNSLVPFTIYAGERSEDNWVALPDGRYVLTAYIDDKAVGITSKYIKPDGVQQRKFVFMVFDKAGNLIKDPDKI